MTDDRGRDGMEQRDREVRPNGFDDVALEAALLDLGGALLLPPTPDIAAAVTRRLRVEAAPRRRLFAPRWNLRWALVAALLAIALLAGAAIGFGWRLPGLVITFGQPTQGPTASPATSTAPTPALPSGPSSGASTSPTSPAPSPSPSRAGLDLGPTTTLDAARAAVQFRLFTPAAGAVAGEAPAVYLDARVLAGQVVLAYPAGPSLPAASTAPVDDSGRPVGLLITQSRGKVDEALLGKVVGPDTTVTEVVINGQPGLWIAGHPHALFILDEHGDRREETLREVGNVLAWVKEGTLIRLELAGGLERAQAIAASMR